MLPQRQTSTRTRNHSHNPNYPKLQHPEKSPTVRQTKAQNWKLWWQSTSSSSSKQIQTFSHDFQSTFWPQHLISNILHSSTLLTTWISRLTGNFANADFRQQGWRCFANDQKWLVDPLFWSNSCSGLVIMQTNVLRTLVLARRPNTQSSSWKVNRNHTMAESYTDVVLRQESDLNMLKIDACFSKCLRNSTTLDRTHYLLIIFAFFF